MQIHCPHGGGGSPFFSAFATRLGVAEPFVRPILCSRNVWQLRIGSATPLRMSWESLCSALNALGYNSDEAQRLWIIATDRSAAKALPILVESQRYNNPADCVRPNVSLLLQHPSQRIRASELAPLRSLRYGNFGPRQPIEQYNPREGIDVVASGASERHFFCVMSSHPPMLPLAHSLFLSLSLLIPSPFNLFTLTL